MTSAKPSIALVVPAFPAVAGGVRSMLHFLYQVISESDQYTPDIISLALSSRDKNSLCLLAPKSWIKGYRITTGIAQGLSYCHVGAYAVELEFQRYQPRRVLTDVLNRYDLIQVVAGTPAWAFVTCNVHRPVCLFTATTIQKERISILSNQRGWRWLWLKVMTDLNWRIEQKVMPKLEYVFAESKYTYQSLNDIVPPERLILSVPGVETDFFFSETYCNDGYILSVARFNDPRKNVRLLFSSYARLRNRMPSAPRLVLAGHKPAEQDWRFAESLGITGWIDLLGPVPPRSQRLVEIYRSASLFVLSSNEEGLGIVILEAMASGLPVISTRCGGPETAVIEGETGYLTPVGDTEALARAIEELLIDPELRRQMGVAGRRVAEERFSITAAGKVFLDRYDALLKS